MDSITVSRSGIQQGFAKIAEHSENRKKSMERVVAHLDKMLETAFFDAGVKESHLIDYIMTETNCNSFQAVSALFDLYEHGVLVKDWITGRVTLATIDMHH